MNWSEIIKVTIEEGAALDIRLGPIVFLILLIWLFVVLILKRKFSRFLNNSHVVKANVKLGHVGDIEIRPDYEDMQIAHQAWVELTTRKAGLPFDEDHDVIVEVYDSWYKLFGEMRDLARQVPARKIRDDEDTQELVSLLVDALNKGLRPHLTKWQARFRNWYEKELSKPTHRSKSPQEIQLLFPQSKELLSDLKEVNKQMVQYTNIIKRIAHGGDLEK